MQQARMKISIAVTVLISVTGHKIIVDVYNSPLSITQFIFPFPSANKSADYSPIPGRWFKYSFLKDFTLSPQWVVLLDN